VKHFQDDRNSENPLIRPVGHLLPFARGEGTLTELLKTRRKILHSVTGQGTAKFIIDIYSGQADRRGM
jgi:hypothetical protein